MSLSFVAGIIAALLLIPSLGMMIWRLLKGPSSADRVIATDLMGLLGIALACIATVLTGYSAYLDIAVGIALFSFLGTVAFAGLLERARVPNPNTAKSRHEARRRPRRRGGRRSVDSTLETR